MCTNKTEADVFIEKLESFVRAVRKCWAHCSKRTQRRVPKRGEKTTQCVEY